MPAPQRFALRTAAWCAAAIVALLASAAAWSISALRFSIDDIHHPAFAAQQLRLAYVADAPANTPALRIEVGQLRIGSRAWSELRIDCARAQLSTAQLSCSGGRTRLRGKILPLTIDVDYLLDSGDAVLRVHGGDGARIEARVRGGKEVTGQVSVLSLADLAQWLPGSAAVDAVRALKPAGRLDGRFEWAAADATTTDAGRLQFVATVGEASFSSADGLRAGEKIAIDFELDAQAHAGRWEWQARADWRDGAMFIDPVYLEAGPTLLAEGSFADKLVDVRSARVSMEGIAQLAASAQIDVAERRVVSAALAVADADLALIGPRWLAPLLAPLLAPASAERLIFAGHASAGLRFADGKLSALDATFAEAGFALRGGDSGSELRVGPLDGHIPWEAGKVTRAQVHTGGGQWEKLTLGPFVLGARLSTDHIEIERTSAAVLDGALVLEGLQLHREAGGWAGSGSVFLEPVSMPRLSDALGLPLMQGVLSASIPAVHVHPGEIRFDGALVISVFDGYVQATGLKVVEPFGAAAQLSANIEGRRLDLAQLTETFRFGSISGLVDVDVRGLELVRWRPAAFDARIASSVGRYPRRISQRAVQNISALGGAGALAALQRGVLSVFDSFGYRELGFGCVLAAGVCTMSGVEGAERAGGGFILVRGGGIPALDVIGYNRRVDWAELVSRLQRVIDDNVAPELR